MRNGALSVSPPFWTMSQTCCKFLLGHAILHGLDQVDDSAKKEFGPDYVSSHAR